jgi:peptidoglycan/LPS O-acetylase OafA/YrhL
MLTCSSKNSFSRVLLDTTVWLESALSHLFRYAEPLLYNGTMHYRHEIDGLRAIAVITVIFFHAGFDAFGGGFVGVDMFFVISGYLITSIILTELQQDKFSIVDFYERRARRILPALFLVMLVCIPFAYFYFLPRDMKDFSKSLIAVSVFASNILFWRESTYFDTAADLKPLLHTWSLAVEEQYYLFFPLFLLLLWRLGKRWIVGALALILVASFILAQWAAYAKPAVAFYLLPARGWELLIGALAAFFRSRTDRGEFGKPINQVGGWLGGVLILYAVFTFDKKIPIPGFYALIPVLGTLLIILFATRQTTIGRFLGNKVLVGIGLISYSAYLWHQPIFAFARHIGIEGRNLYLYGILSAMSLCLAFLSWRFVELPFRDRKRFRPSAIFGLSLFLTVLFGSLGFVGYRFNEGVSRFGGDERYPLLVDRLRFNFGLSKDCDVMVADAENCRTSSQPEILLWGDSFAMHLASGFLSSNPDVKLIQATVAHCAPVFGLAYPNAMHGAQNCIDSNDFVYELFRRYPSIKYVVLGSPGFHIGRESVTTRDGNRVLNENQIYEHFVGTLENIRALGLIPIVFAPPPISTSDTGLCLMRAEMIGVDKSKCDFSLMSSKSSQGPTKEVLRRISNNYRVVWLEEVICSIGLCKAAIDDVLLYMDDGHFSHEGSAFLGKKIDFYKIVTEINSVQK